MSVASTARSALIGAGEGALGAYLYPISTISPWTGALAGTAASVCCHLTFKIASNLLARTPLNVTAIHTVAATLVIFASLAASGCALSLAGISVSFGEIAAFYTVRLLVERSIYSILRCCFDRPLQADL